MIAKELTNKINEVVTAWAKESFNTLKQHGWVKSKHYKTFDMTSYTHPHLPGHTITIDTVFGDAMHFTPENPTGTGKILPSNLHSYLKGIHKK